MKAAGDLNIDVLGIPFTVNWGTAVTVEQRLATAEAWSRCVSARPHPLARKTEPSPLPLPFTASLYFDSRVSEGVRHLGADTFEGLSEAVTSEVTIAAILERAGELTMLHACGVAEPGTGAVIALVAKSGTGKTTASSQLARALGYVTDETVAIRPDGSVVPYPKPLSVKQETPGAAKLQVGPDELGLQSAPEKPYIKAIALLDRVTAGAYQLPVIEQVPFADAVLALVPDTSSQAALVQPLESLCRLIDSVGGVYRVTYSEAADLKDSLAPLFRTDPVNPLETADASWSPALSRQPAEQPDGQSGEQAGDQIPAGWVQRADVVDAVEIGEDLLVLTNSQVTRLSGIGPLIWASAQRPIPLESLAQRIGSKHGLPDGYEDLLVTAVDALVAGGVLLRGPEPPLPPPVA